MAALSLADLHPRNTALLTLAGGMDPEGVWSFSTLINHKYAIDIQPTCVSVYDDTLPEYLETAFC